MKSHSAAAGLPVVLAAVDDYEPMVREALDSPLLLEDDVPGGADAAASLRW